MKIKSYYIEGLDYKEEFFFEEIINNQEKLQILLESDTQILKISFYDFVSYRVTNESYLLLYWSDLKGSKLNSESFFSTVEHSSYIDEVSKLSFDFFSNSYSKEGLKHYLITTLGECIEVLSFEKPIIKVELLPNPDGSDM